MNTLAIAATWPRVGVRLRQYGIAVSTCILLGTCVVLDASWRETLKTGLAFLLYYRLIYRVGPALASTVTYLIPVFGAVFAWLFLHEPITVQMVAAGALILGSVAFSQKR